MLYPEVNLVIGQILKWEMGLKYILLYHSDMFFMYKDLTALVKIPTPVFGSTSFDTVFDVCKFLTRLTSHEISLTKYCDAWSYSVSVKYSLQHQQYHIWWKMGIVCTWFCFVFIIQTHFATDILSINEVSFHKRPWACHHSATELSTWMLDHNENYVI